MLFLWVLFLLLFLPSPACAVRHLLWPRAQGQDLAPLPDPVCRLLRRRWAPLQGLPAATSAPRTPAHPTRPLPHSTHTPPLPRLFHLGHTGHHSSERGGRALRRDAEHQPSPQLHVERDDGRQWRGGLLSSCDAAPTRRVGATWWRPRRKEGEERERRERVPVHSSAARPPRGKSPTCKRLPKEIQNGHLQRA